MSKPSERSRLALTLLCFGAVQALAIGALLLPPPGAPGASPKSPQRLAAVAPREVFAPSPLDALRDEATLGDREAGPLLVTQLLDAYERTSDTDHLFEAVQWIDRGWSTGSYQQSGAATRVFERYCGHPVLRWHWLCDAGE